MEAPADPSPGPTITTEVGDFDGSTLPVRYTVVLARGEVETWVIDVPAPGELHREDRRRRAEERADALAGILRSLVLVTKPLREYERPRCRLLRNRRPDSRMWFAVTGWTDDLVDPLVRWNDEHPYDANGKRSAGTGLVYGQVRANGGLPEVCEKVERKHVEHLGQDLGARPGDNLAYLREGPLVDDHVMAQYLRGRTQGEPDAVRVWFGLFAPPVEVTGGVTTAADARSQAMVTPFNADDFIDDRNRFCAALRRASNGRCCPLCP